ncbi:class I histocompatibility antigen, F10 alpha chain-like [Apteryx rowi]|uniref:class I histocompatibility antigen, F10 alpha chain-like n=1 Tax=Apteryx rowi TaxID=308060 RepID=UPI000E1D0BD1|nr:class I histocompatibility antigen, F10 alpha chain-like [Apteryx rowi]
MTTLEEDELYRNGIEPSVGATGWWYHTWQGMYGCDLLEDGGIREFYQDAYDGRDFIAFDKDTLMYTAADAGAEITKREREAAGEPESWKHYLETTCIEWLQIYVEYGKATLERRAACVSGYHTVQAMYGCDLLEDGGIQGFYQDAYDGRDFLTLDKDMLTFTAADAGAEIIKRDREAAGEPERWKHYLENTCIEELRKFVEYGKARLERRERPAVRVSGKESHGLLTLSCRAHGFYPRSIAINWLRKGHVQAQETKWGSTVPNSDGTYHAWASIEALAAEKDEYQCRVEHASLPEPGLFSWEPESNLLPIVIGVVIAALVVIAAIAGFVFWKSRSGMREKGYKPATAHDGGSSSSGTGSNTAT